MQNLPRHRRVAKVKEFVSAPFIKCPDCEEDKFGVLMIFEHHYARRCINCWFDECFPLPKLRKCVVYLDQFVISNIMKELDPSAPSERRGPHTAYFRELFETLDRVCKLQLAVCPESSVHDHESVVVGPHYEKLRTVFRHLSYGVSLRRPNEIFHDQISAAFKECVGPESAKATVAREHALDGNTDGWTDRFRLDLNYTIPGFAKSLKVSTDAKTRHLQGVCQGWKDSPTLSFKTVFEDEIQELGTGILTRYLRYLHTFDRASRGEVPVSDVAFPPDEMSLIQDLQEMPSRTTPNTVERVAEIRSFLGSKHFREIPFAKTWALFWATLARAVKSGMSEENYPQGSIYNDIEAVGAFSPYCDAMFVDREIEHLTRQGDLGRYLSSGAKIFSLRNKDDFLEYLRDLERSASPEHMNLVREVYGPCAGRPFVELLKK